MIGIDVGSYAIKISVSKKSGRKHIVNDIHHQILPSTARGLGGLLERQKIIADLIKRFARNEKSIALSIPTSATMLKTITVAENLSEEDLEGEVQLALIDLIPFTLDQVYVDFVRQKKPKKNHTQDIFIAATKKDIVDTALANINIKKSYHKVVDVEIAAIGLLIEKIKGTNYRDTYLVINIGYLSTNIYAYAQNELLFSHEQQIGGQHLTESISETMGISLAEAEDKKLHMIGTIPQPILNSYTESLTEQISSTFDSYLNTNEQPINGIYLTGGGSLIPGLIPALKEILNNPAVETLPITDAIKIKTVTDAKIVNSLSAVATGLALRS